MLQKLLSPHRDRAYALLRIVSGLLFSFHGVQKIFGVLTDHQPAFGSQIWVGGIIELTCGVLVALGLFTRGAAFLASGTMAVAYTQFHWKLQTGAQFFPGVNKGELALVYAFVFLYVACRGPGPWSVDGARRRG
ncbi:MAG: DoxX family protein [Deltaproteobacteria bacterium]|nr:DoxX family protein [Deltaproteobacteria bacterium]MCB9786697.1 DoxX family protein [Deltaproteobacteria bacterium]